MMMQEANHEKPRCRQRFCSDRVALLSLIAIAALLKIIILLQHPILARDGIQHVRLAYDLLESPWASTLREHPYHPGYALTLTVSAVIYQLFDPGTLTPTEWQWCAHVSSSLAGILLVIPLYGLGRCFYSIRTAWLGSLLFITLPILAQTTADALTESWYLLFTLCALCTLVHGVRSRRSSWFVMAGLFAGLAYVVRIEAVILLAAMVVWTIHSRWRQAKPLPSGCSVRNVAIMMACFLLPPLPYMVTIGKFSNRPVVQQVVQLKNDSPLHFGPELLLASERLQPGVNGHLRSTVQWSEATLLMLTTHLRAGNFILWPLACLGLLVIWRVRRNDPAFLLLIGLVVLHTAMLMRLALTAGYVNERHTLLMMVLLAQIAAVGLLVLAQWLRRVVWQRPSLRTLSIGLIAVVLAADAPKAIQPLHQGQEGHRQAGFWLAEHFRYNHDSLVDPYSWASFYAGLSFKPRSTISDLGNTLGIIDPKDADLNRQRDWKNARLMEKNANTIWCWPAQGKPKIIIKQVSSDGDHLGASFSY